MKTDNLCKQRHSHVDPFLASNPLALIAHLSFRHPRTKSVLEREVVDEILHCLHHLREPVKKEVAVMAGQLRKVHQKRM
jgi:hypothetical protein